jgi:hypothetical protein
MLDASLVNYVQTCATRRIAWQAVYDQLVGRGWPDSYIVSVKRLYYPEKVNRVAKAGMWIGGVVVASLLAGAGVVAWVNDTKVNQAAYFSVVPPASRQKQFTLAPTPSVTQAVSLVVDEVVLEATSSDRAVMAETPAPSPTVKTISKDHYVIAVFGDSMIDTMGEEVDYLASALRSAYPGVEFSFYNYGVGAQNIEQGRARLGEPLVYKTRNYPPITQLKPDITIIGSFAYNPFSPHERDRHWLGLIGLVEAAREFSQEVYILAEVAPLKEAFGTGKNGVDWPVQTRVEHAMKIGELLQNAVGVSQAIGAPLINVYAQTVTGDGFGQRVYVNADDGIHPSVAGHRLTAQTIVRRLAL